jgi:hypothetical protein
MSASDSFENKVIDWLFRGQSLGITGASANVGSGPSTLYIGLTTTAPTDSSGGTEVSGNNYARVAINSTLANWAGTQGPGSTTVSTGTSGITSNNIKVQFNVPSGPWGTVTHFTVRDALVSGNLLFYGALQTPRAIVADQDVNFPPGTLQVTVG